MESSTTTTTTTAERMSRGPEETMELQEQEQPLILQEQKMVRRILVAVDESDDSFSALKWVLDNFFRRSTGGATPLTAEAEQDDHLTIMHVVQRFPQYVFPGAPVALPAVSLSESATKAHMENAAALLSRALQICEERKVAAESVIREGDPKEMICQATEEMHVDLLVVASRGLGKIKRAFLGSVSDYCAHHAKCPVLIVKPPKESHHK